jgi:hypothetical protein
MIKKVVAKVKLNESSDPQNDLAFWLEKAPEDRVSAVEHLRRQFYGNTTRLQRTARVIQRASR